MPVAWADLPSREFTTQTKTATSTTPQADTALWTPASGKRIILQGVIACSQTPSAGVEVESNNIDVIPPFAIESYGCRTFEAGGSALWMGGTDATLTFSVESGSSFSIMAWGYEIQ
jgi:hypothetical protein